MLSLEEMDDKEPCLDEKECTGVERATPTTKWRRVARDAGIATSLSFGDYSKFLGIQGSSKDLFPKASSPFDFTSFGQPVSVP